MKNKVDIIMGVYNCEKYLKESIDSILTQSFKNWKLIICDDKSTDKTLKIAESYAKRYPKRIILLRNRKNMGLNYTLNKCLKKSSAKYIARMDGDDISDIHRLKKEVDFLDKNKEYAFVSTAVETFNENGKWGEIFYKEKPRKKDFLAISPFCHAASMMRRSSLDKVGRYTAGKKLLRVEDYNLWFKMYAKGYRGYNIQEILYSVRDGQQAARRRTWQNRLNEYYCRKTGYKMLDIAWYQRLARFRPLILGIMPPFMYQYLHKKRVGIGGKK